MKTRHPLLRQYISNINYCRYHDLVNKDEIESILKEAVGYRDFEANYMISKYLHKHKCNLLELDQKINEHIQRFTNYITQEKQKEQIKKYNEIKKKNKIIRELPFISIDSNIFDINNIMLIGKKESSRNYSLYSNECIVYAIKFNNGEHTVISNNEFDRDDLVEIWKKWKIK